MAERLYQVSQSVTTRLNHGKKPGDQSRARRALIIRGYNIADEQTAIKHLLRNPGAGETAAPSEHWFRPSVWRLHLSAAYWVLALLRSPAVPALHEDDSEALFSLQAEIDREAKFASLRNVATGRITWDEYLVRETATAETLKDILRRLCESAAILCLTPAVSEHSFYLPIKTTLVKGLVVDEAGSMSRPDLFSAWGNTLLPCMMAGDDMVRS